MTSTLAWDSVGAGPRMAEPLCEADACIGRLPSNMVAGAYAVLNMLAIHVELQQFPTILDSGRVAEWQTLRT